MPTDGKAQVKDLLTPLGFPVHEAGNGKEALQQVAARHPEAIITDIRMPEMAGLELIRQIRQTPEGQALTVIATSASVHEQNHQESLAAGSQAFLPKPVDADLLYHQLHDLLSIEWVYQEVAEAPDESVMLLPSSADLDTLAHAALIGDILFIQEQLDTFERNAPQLHAFVTTLRSMVQRSRLVDIQAFLRTCQQQQKQEPPDAPCLPLTQERLQEALAQLPADVLDNLKQVARQCDPDAIDQIIQHIRITDAACANALQRLAEEFEFGRIMSIIQKPQM